MAYWAAGQPGEWTSTCSNHATRSTPHVCMQYRASSGTIVEVEPARCPATVPASTEQAAVYTSCSFEWLRTDSICIGPTTRSTNASCIRSGGDAADTTVPDGQCDAASRPGSTRPDAGCTPVASYSLQNSFDTGAPPFVFDSTDGPVGEKTDWYGATKRGVPGTPYEGFYSYASGAMVMHPGETTGHRAILRFVAPSDGYYDFGGRMFDAGGSIDGVIVSIDGQESYVHGSRERPFAFTKRLAAGEGVEFTVDCYGTPSADSTGIEISVNQY